MIRLTYCHPKTIVFLEYVVACVMCGVVGDVNVIVPIIKVTQDII